MQQEALRRQPGYTYPQPYDLPSLVHFDARVWARLVLVKGRFSPQLPASGPYPAKRAQGEQI